MEIRIGQVTHYYNRIGVAVLLLTGELRQGDTIHILGRTTELSQRVFSLEVEHRRIYSATSGMEIALKVDEPVRAGDKVYKVVELEAEAQPG